MNRGLGNWFTSASDPTMASAVPAYDRFGPDFGGYWSLNDWITWHQALVSTYGQATANQKFVAAWDLNTFASAPLNELETNEAARQYFISTGLGDSIDPSIFGLATDFFSGATKITAGANKAASAISWIFPIAGVALLYFAVQSLGKDPGGQAKKFAGAVGELY